MIHVVVLQTRVNDRVSAVMLVVQLELPESLCSLAIQIFQRAAVSFESAFVFRGDIAGLIKEGDIEVGCL